MYRITVVDPTSERRPRGVPAHGIAGLTGGLLTGILADPAVTQYVDPVLKGAIYGNLYELGIRLSQL